MKKIISLILVTLLMGSVAYAISSPGVGDILGQGQFPSEPGKIFRLVRFVPMAGKASLTDVACTVDSLVIWDKTSDDGVTVTLSVTTGDSAVAGIVVTAIQTPEAGAQGNTAAEDYGKRNWGYVQTYGLSQVNVSAVAGVQEGAAMGVGGSYPGEASGYYPLAGLSGSTVGAAQVSDAGAAGFFYDAATAGDDDVEVFLKCN